MNCKTEAYGANISICEDCGAVRIHYNSCRNRCCPMCQAVSKEMWMDARREDVLDAPYFHLVFTVPDILNSAIYNNQKQLYDTLHYAASDAISEQADTAWWRVDAQKMSGRITVLNFSSQFGSFPKYSVENTWKNWSFPVLNLYNGFRGMCSQNVLSGFGITDFFVLAANARSSFYAAISLAAKSISQNFVVRRYQKYKSSFMG